MAKQIIQGTESRQGILRGINQMADAVKITLGPKGRNVVIDKKFGSPTITNDGVTIAREIELKDAPAMALPQLQWSALQEKLAPPLVERWLRQHNSI